MRRILIGLFAIALACSGCGRQTPPEQGAHEEEAGPAEAHEEAEAPGIVRIDPEMLRDLRITTAAVESREGGEGITALGEVGVNEEGYAEVVSPLEARVLRLLASAGDVVRPDQHLAELQSVDLGKARADLMSARARAMLAEQALERKRGLASERIVPVRELQEAEAEAKAAQAQVEAAASALVAMGILQDDPTRAGADASRFWLTSPIHGTVIERDAARGQVAGPSGPLFRIADLSRLWLTVHAFERDALRIRPGTQARVTFPALPGREFQGRVTFVGRQVDVSSRTIPVRLEIPNEEELLRPGMSATAWVPVGESGGRILSVPSASLQRMQEGWYVFLPGEDGRFEMRAVGRGRDLAGEVEILSGLEEGQIVVVEGAFLLKAEAEKSRGEGGHHDH
ncbi:MAG: efflux RND transporter periplasmic adaptor subunit [Candidatus Polarisedimenticolia bacterium]